MPITVDFSNAPISYPSPTFSEATDWYYEVPIERVESEWIRVFPDHYYAINGNDHIRIAPNSERPNVWHILIFRSSPLTQRVRFASAVSGTLEQAISFVETQSGLRY